MELPVIVHQARLGAEEFRVIRPGQPLTRAALLDHSWHLDLYADEEAARRLTGLWMLAARSPRSLVHLPLRANHPPAEGVPEDSRLRLDLVLLHHSLRFAPARWKRLRARLDRGRPQTASLPEADRPQDAAVGRAARRHRENRDLFHQHVHADTLFMAGSAKVFRATAGHFLDVAREGPGHVPPRPGYPYYFTEFHHADGTLGTARDIRVEYSTAWPPASP